MSVFFSACSRGAVNEQQGRAFASQELVEVLKSSLAKNGLVTLKPKSKSHKVDVMATSVVHLAGVAGIAKPGIEDIIRACTDYGSMVPQHQISQELITIVSPETFLKAVDEADCVTVDPPSFEGGEAEDPQQFLLAAANWTAFPGVDRSSLNPDDVVRSINALGADVSSPWARWNCETIAEAISVSELCSLFKSPRTVTQVTNTEDLMDLRASLELSKNHGFPQANPVLVDSALDLPLADALDAAQIQRIAVIEQQPSMSLDEWIAEQVQLIGSSGFVEVEVEQMGTIDETYIASRLLESSTTEIVTESTKNSLDEIVTLAQLTSEFDGVAAQVMRASILEAAGLLSVEEKHAALESYSQLGAVPCPEEFVNSCVFAADAAFQLDENVEPLTITVPQDIAVGTEGDGFIYRVLAFNWTTKNLDDWLAVAHSRELDPVADVATPSLQPSVRLWAAAARSVLSPQLDTVSEGAVRRGVSDLVNCSSVAGLALSDRNSDRNSEHCDTDTTMAYYLSGLWGIDD